MSILQQNPIERVASLQPNAIILYKSFPRSSKPKDDSSLSNLAKGRDGEYNGYMSPATGRTVKRFLTTWLSAMESNMHRSEGAKNKYYPTFVTLTLPSVQQHTDNLIKREFLNRLVLRMKRNAGVKYYFWRAEPQENGNIHFHILVDRWIGWEWLRDSWNVILREHGYIDAYRKEQLAYHKNGFKVRRMVLKTWGLEAQEKAYQRGMAEDWQNPNTTDVHKLQSIENVAAYVVKYVTKKPDILAKKDYGEGRVINCVHTRKIEGRIWGCSDELRDLKNYRDTYSVEQGVETHENAEVVNYVANVEIEVGKDDVYEDEYIKVIRLKKGQEYFLKKYCQSLRKRYVDYYKEVYNLLYVRPVSQVNLFSEIQEKKVELIEERAKSCIVKNDYVLFQLEMFI